jgi:hypothetical protein
MSEDPGFQSEAPAMRADGSDVTPETTVEPVSDGGSTESGRRGRPRPQATIERDEQVRALLRDNGAMTRSAIAEKLGWEPKDAYASLWRLRNYEQAVEKVPGKSEWQLAGATPAPPSE